jgi:acyl carrier protein
MNGNNTDANIKQVQQVFKLAMGDSVEVNINTEKDMVAEWDSINHLSLIVELENEFALGLSMDEIENLNTVRQIIEWVNKKNK